MLIDTKSTAISPFVYGFVRATALVATLLLAGYLASLGSDMPVWGAPAAMACVLAVDAAFAHWAKVRGRKLVASLVQTALVILALTGYSMLPSDWFTVSGAAWIAAYVLCISVGAVVFEPMQATFMWLIAGGTFAQMIGRGLGSWAMTPSQDAQVSPALDYAFGALGYGSVGLFVLYLRRVLGSGASRRHIASRVGVVVGAVLLSVVVSGSAMWYLSLYDNQWAAMESVNGMFLVGRTAAAQLVHDFTPAEISSGTPAVVDELIRLGRASGIGFTLLDRDRIVVAVRQPIDVSASEESTPPAYGLMTISAAEASFIRAQVRSGDYSTHRGFGWTTVGSDEVTAPVLAVTDRGFVPDAGAGTTAKDTLEFLAQNVFPALFAVMMVVVSLALLALERRDRAVAGLLAEQERARLSRDAHDRVYNRMAALANRLEGADPGSGAASAGEVRGALGDLQRILGDVDVRASVGADAGPDLFDDLVADQAERWGMRVSLEGGGALAGLDPRLSWELQCIVEEALTNAGKHSHATVATVRAVREGRALRITMLDNGSGIVPAVGSDGLPVNASGLRGMLDRVNTLGGSLKITSGGEGTTIDVEVPL